MAESVPIRGRRSDALLNALAVVQTLALLGVLAGLYVVNGSLKNLARLENEQLAPTIAQGPWPYVQDGSTLDSVSLERLADSETIPVGERRPIVHGEWLNVTRYAGTPEQATINGRDTLVRKSIWVHIPSRTRVVLTYSNARQSADTAR